MSLNISALFNKFAYQEITVVETNRAIALGGEKINIKEVKFADENDPALVEMKKIARENGLTLRLWLPGMVGTADMNPNRINIYIDKHKDGKWRIAPHFTCG